MNENKEFDAGVNAATPVVFSEEIISLIRSDLTPKKMREQIGDYHEKDIALALELVTTGSNGIFNPEEAMTRQDFYTSAVQLLDTLGYSQAQADTTKGFYDLATTIYNMPCSLIVPIAISVIPAISSALSLKDHEKVKETEESAARIAGLISLPCAVGLSILSRPIMALLGGAEYTGENLILAGNLLTVLGLCVFLYAIIQYTNALLQAHGYAHIPVVNMLVCGVAKLAVVYILVGNPNIGLMGAPIGALICYFCIAILNLIAIRKFVPQRPRLIKALVRPALAAITMGVAVWAAHKGLQLFISSNLILCGGSIVVGVVVYFVSVVLFKAITAEDCKLLPKGDQIAKILHL